MAIQASQMTFDNYINNPTGGRSHMVGQKEAAKAVYSDKFNKLMMRQAGNIPYQLYKDDPDRFVLYIKMPSESTEMGRYDVVIEFWTKDTVQKKLNKLDGYYVRFYSNDPNFTFTYAYTFKKNHLIIPELVDKLSAKSLKDKPKATNPNTTVGYVKSIYFAYLFWKMRGLNNKLNWVGAPPLKNFSFASKIMNASRKLMEIQHLRTIQQASKKGSMHIGTDRLDVQANQAQALTNARTAYKRAESAKISAYSPKSKTVHVISRKRR